MTIHFKNKDGKIRAMDSSDFLTRQELLIHVKEAADSLYGNNRLRELESRMDKVSAASREASYLTNRVAILEAVICKMIHKKGRRHANAQR